MEEQNAIIEGVKISKANHGLLSIGVYLKYESGGQGFGGVCLYKPGDGPDGLAGHFMWRVMEIAGVDSWDKVVGKTVRARSTDFSPGSSGLVAIGHIVKDDWFEPTKDFAR